MRLRKIVRLGIAICLSFTVIGAVILAFFSAPIEKSAITRDEYLIVKADEYKTKDFGYYSAWDNVVSFNVLNGTIKSCEPLTEALYLEWQAGRYVPNWTETDQGVYEYRGTHLQPPLMGAVYLRYFLFFNPDSYDKVIHWQITSYWKELNTTNLTSGTVLVVTGLVICLGLVLMHMLKSNSLVSVIRQS
jgi:hypothetical protein